ncbi:MAG TPA: DUF4403 family protein, partial [Phnomibacter sp.]|nr:DUF4403 family protein [Phnomibacter sp.]
DEQKFGAGHFDFDVTSDNLLVKAGSSLLHDMLRDTLASYMGVNLDTFIQKLPGIIETAIGKGKVGQTLDVTMDDLQIRSVAIHQDTERIHLVVHATFSSALRIKRIRAGKGVQINAE